MDLTTLSPMTIVWNEGSSTAWDTLYQRCYQPTLPQTWQYAYALAQARGIGCEMGTIYFNQQPVGLVLVEFHKLFGRRGFYRIARGPLWVYQDVPLTMHELTWRQIRRRYGMLKLQPLWAMPELPDKPDHRRLLARAGFVKLRFDGRDAYQTPLLNIEPSLNELRAGLAKNWRGALQQAERSPLKVVVANTGTAWEDFLTAYSADQKQRRLPGMTASLLRALARVTARSDCYWVQAWLAYDAELYGGVVIARHGRAATYIAGWNGQAGRDAKAHHLLLWRVVETLQNQGVRWFDLGGITPDAPGLTKFKLGLGATLQRLVPTVVT